jgi:lysyl-tRNA synthetase class 2
VRDVFIARSKIIAETRRFIDACGFFECETPELLHIAGGAAARPFLTGSNALGDIQRFCRVKRRPSES